MRHCNKCNTTKELSEFNINRSYKGGYHFCCRSCDNAHRRNYLKNRGGKNEKDKITNRKWSLKKLYGMTLSQYEELVKVQEGKCAICKMDFSSQTGSTRTIHPFVDHCHMTGKVRGLLCMKCNTGLGYFKDSVDLIRKAIAYLRDSETSA